MFTISTQFTNMSTYILDLNKLKVKTVKIAEA